MENSLKCWNCGAPLDTATAQNKVIRCPFCNENNLIKDLESPRSDDKKVRYYPAVRSLKQFEEQCEQLLAEDPLVPNDIFKEIDFNKIQQVYIPVWTFEGLCHYSYYYYKDSQTINKQEECSFFHYSTAYKGECLPNGIDDQLIAFSFEKTVSPEITSIDELNINGYIRIQSNLRISSQQKDFSEQLQNIVIQEEKSKWPIGAKLRSFQAKIASKEDPEAEIVYIPLLIAECNYRGVDYFIASDAFKGEILLKKLPEDEARKQLLKSTFEGKYLGIGCICYLIPVILWILGFVGFWKACLWFIPFAIVGGIFMMIGGEKDKKKKQSIIDQAKRERNNYR